MSEPCGILLLNKPLHLSSYQAVKKVKWLYKIKKAGHAGSLDPLATGLLPIFLGEATKFIHYALMANKCYEVVVQLGMTTTTGDAEGEVLSKNDVPILDAEKIKSVLASFEGERLQVPPMYSALKHQGKPLYHFARLGIELPREPRKITLFSLTYLSLEANCFSFRVHCSKGTYVRSLVEEIGSTLGCGAYVKALHRTRVGERALGDMYDLPQLETFSNTSPTALLSLLHPMDAMLMDRPAACLAPLEARAVFQGKTIEIAEFAVNDLLRLYNQETKTFIGLGEVTENHQLKGKRLISHRS